MDARSFLSKFNQKGDNSVKRFFFKCRKFDVGKVLIHTFVNFHIPKPTGLSTVMFESTKEYIEKHPKTHKKRHNFAKNQNFKNLRKALLDFHLTNICARFQLSTSIAVDASPLTRIHTNK